MDNTTKSYRVRTKVGEDTILNVNLQQDMEFMDVLSLKINQQNLYKIHTSNYGVLIGRVLANDAFGIPNVKISVFIELEDADKQNTEITNIYPYASINAENKDNVRYNLLPDTSNNKCYQIIGNFPSKRLVIDDNNELEIYEKYWKFTTVTNQSGDYCIYGLPTGTSQIHCDLDISDCGILSQKPIDLEYKGYDENLFQNPYQFKSGTNLNNLAQVYSQNNAVFIYPFWGDTENGDIAITRNDIKIQYQFEPTCVFMGSVITDPKNTSIGHDCKPSSKLGVNKNLVGSSGTIEMIRKTTNGLVEEIQIKGNELIDSDGVWCYQIPMNLDYVGTDEYGNIVPVQNSNTGIPTRTRVRFRMSLNEGENAGTTTHYGKMLIPNNPDLSKNTGKQITINTDDREDGSKRPSIDDYYKFGSSTPENCFRDLYWNKVYSIKSYIPRIQKGHNINTNEHSGIKLTNYHNNVNPFPYNNLRIHLSFPYLMICILSNILWFVVYNINFFLIGPLDTGLIAIVGLFKLVKWAGSLFGNHPKLNKLIDNITIPCISLTIPSSTETCIEYKYYPGCSKRWNPIEYGYTEDECKPSKGCKIDTNHSDFENTIQQLLAQDNEAVSLDFYNDWINGTIYMPLWYWKKTPKRRFFFGLFTKKGKNSFCGCDKSKNAYIMYPCLDTHNSSGTTNDNDFDAGNWHNNEKHTKYHDLRHGLIKNTENASGLNLYYYAHGINRGGNDSEKDYYYRLYATDIILLGSVNDCDIDGIPQFFKYLPITTYNDVPFVRETYINCDSGNTEETNEALTGYDVKLVHDKESDATYGNGYFLDLGCLNAKTFHKTCVNASRLCELGVSMDMEYVDENILTENGTVSGVVQSDGMITRYEIHDNDSRAMFASLNNNGFDPYDEVLDSKTGYYKYNFKYIYPTDFEGNLKNSAPRYTKAKNMMRRTYDIYNPNYAQFRYGANGISAKTKFYEVSSLMFPVYNNSFYFYFGYKPGSTALDKFNSKFYSVCTDNKFNPFNAVITTSNPTSCGQKDGYIMFTIEDISMPYKYSLYSFDDIEQKAQIYTSDEKVFPPLSGDTLDKRPKKTITDIDGLTSGILLSGLSQQEYKLVITDNDDNTMTMYSSLTISYITLDYTIAPLGKYVLTEGGILTYSESAYYGTITINGITIDGNYINKDDLTFIRNSHPVNGVLNAYSADTYTIYSGANTTEEDKKIAMLNIYPNPESSYTKVIGVTSYYYRGVYPSTVSNGTSFIVSGFDQGIQYLTYPYSLNAEIHQTCSGASAYSRTYLWNVDNGEIFNMYVNTMPFLFLSPYNIIKNPLTAGTLFNNETIAQDFINGSDARFAPAVTTITDIADENRDPNKINSFDKIEDLILWNRLERVNNYTMNEDLYYPELYSIWLNENISDLPETGSVIEIIDDEKNLAYNADIIEYKLNTLFSLCNGIYVTNTNYPYVNITGSGGKSPLLSNNLYPNAIDANTTFIPTNGISSYTFSSNNYIEGNNLLPNVIFSNYRKYRNEEDFIGNQIVSGIAMNPLFNTSGKQGNYSSLFTNNGGYENSTTTAITKPYDELPSSAISNAYPYHVISKDDTNLKNSVLSSDGYETAFSKYFRTVFVDKRMDYSFIFITKCKTDQNYCRIEGKILNCIPMSYQYTENNSDGMNYNIVSKYSIMGNHHLTIDVDKAYNDTNAEYFYMGHNMSGTTSLAPKYLYSLTSNLLSGEQSHVFPALRNNTEQYYSVPFSAFGLTDGLEYVSLDAISCSYDMEAKLSASDTDSQTYSVYATTMPGDEINLEFPMDRNVTFAGDDLICAATYSYESGNYDALKAYGGWFDVLYTSTNGTYQPTGISTFISISSYNGYGNSVTRMPMFFKIDSNDANDSFNSLVTASTASSYNNNIRTNTSQIDYILYGQTNITDLSSKTVSFACQWDTDNHRGYWPAKRYGSWENKLSDYGDFLPDSYYKIEDNSCNVCLGDYHGSFAVVSSAKCLFDDWEHTYMVKRDNVSNKYDVVYTNEDGFYNAYFWRRYPSGGNDGKSDIIPLIKPDNSTYYDSFAIITDTILKPDTKTYLTNEIRLLNTSNIFNVNPVSAQCSVGKLQNYYTVTFTIKYGKNNDFLDLENENALLLYNLSPIVPGTPVTNIDRRYYFPSSFVYENTGITMMFEVVDSTINSTSTYSFGIFIKTKYGLKWCFKYQHYGIGQCTELGLESSI